MATVTKTQKVAFAKHIYRQRERARERESARDRYLPSLHSRCPAKFYAKHTQFAHCLKEHYNQIIKEERGSFEKFLQDSQKVRMCWN